MSFLFAFAILGTLGVVVWRRLQGRGKGQIEEDREPRLVTSHEAIDREARALRCRCGARYSVVGEGPARAGPMDGELWRVVLQCQGCDRRRAVVFRLAS
jgi:hypothetical protein